MATRLYLHRDNYDRAFFGGTYNQGVPLTQMYAVDIDSASNTICVCGIFDPDRPSIPAALRSSPDQKNWSQAELRSGGSPLLLTEVDFTEVRYVNGNWFAGTADGKIFLSTDGGKIWNVVYSDANPRYVERVRYANGYYVAVGDTGGAGIGGLIVWSTDGTNWTAITGVANSNIIGLDYNPSTGTWLAVGSAGNLWTATDPTGTWTNTTNGSTSRYYVQWDSVNSVWITCGVGGLLQTSPDGSTWTNRNNTGLTGNMWGIIGPVNGYYYVCGVGGAIIRATDPTGTWSIISPTGTPPPDNINTFYSIVNDSSNNIYITGGGGKLYKSSDDGSTWSILGQELTTTYNTPDSNAFYDIESTTLKLMNTDISVLPQTNVINTSAALSTQQNALMQMYASYPLNVAQTVGGGDMTLNTADQSSSNAAAFRVTSMNVYVWRPSQGIKVGTVIDASNTLLGGAASSTSETVQNITGITTSSVQALPGDIIVCEIWATWTQTMATSYTVTFYYDGTTVNTTQGATVSDHASFIEFTENLTFSTTPITPSNVKNRSFFVFFN